MKVILVVIVILLTSSCVNVCLDCDGEQNSEITKKEKP